MSKKSSIIYLADLKARPFGNSDKLAHQFPAAGLFDRRHHFLYNSNIRELAVYATFINKLSLRSASSRRRARASVCFSLIKVDDGVIVSERGFDMSMAGGEAVCGLRVDLPLEHITVETSCPYRLMVEIDGVEQSVGFELWFFSASEFGLPPTRWFYPLSGGVMAPEFQGDRLVRSLGDFDGDSAVICFRLENKLPRGLKVMPELEVSLTNPLGRTETNLVEIFFGEPVSGMSSDGSVWSVMTRMEMFPGLKGYYYAELKCMGYPIAAFLFSNAGGMVGGQWTKKELTPVIAYSPEAGERRFLHLLEKLARRRPSDPKSHRLLRIA